MNGLRIHSYASDPGSTTSPEIPCCSPLQSGFESATAPPLAYDRGRRSGLLEDEPVPVRVADHRLLPPRLLLQGPIELHPPGHELLAVLLEVSRAEHKLLERPGRHRLEPRHQRQRRCSSLRGYLYPPDPRNRVIFAAEFEPQFLDVELLRALLIGYRNGNHPHLLNCHPNLTRRRFTPIHRSSSRYRASSARASRDLPPSSVVLPQARARMSLEEG